MLWWIALLLLLVILFGGLGLFVAKVFLIGVLVALLVGLVLGMFSRRGGAGHSGHV